MIAYNKEWLNNLSLREEADKALKNDFITKTEQENIYNKYQSNFYTPNVFIRIGLFILTAVIALFTLGLFALLLLSGGSDAAITAVFVIIGMLAYIGLEVIVKKRHYKSGVDDALIWIAPICIIGGLNITSSVSWLGNSLLIFIFSTVLFIRFINWIMGSIAAIAFISVVFFAYIKFGDIAKATAPFVVMIASTLLYFLATKLSSRKEFKFYINGPFAISIVSLVCFYLTGNYFIVRETSIAMFDLDLSNDQSIPFGWLFWALTFVVPIAYLLRGILKKDVVFLRLGLILFAAIVFTVRYYYHPLPLETAAVIGGCLFILVSYFLIQWLREPKFGFTYKKDTDENNGDSIQIESLIIAETFSKTSQSTDSGIHYGGGSAGGAGASGDF
ncbi:MAG: hypothetical protein QM764_23715 [Chitinophagaceae bacterium]